jgi:hypothetical protein
MTPEAQCLVDELLAGYDRLLVVGTDIFLSEANDIAKTCALLTPHVADPADPDEFLLRALLRKMEDYILSAVLHDPEFERQAAGFPGGELPDWLRGDPMADLAARAKSSSPAPCVT